MGVLLKVECFYFLTADERGLMLKLIQIHVVGYVLTNPAFWNRIKVFPSPCHNFNVCLCPKRFENLKACC